MYTRIKAKTLNKKRKTPTKYYVFEVAMNQIFNIYVYKFDIGTGLKFYLALGFL